MSAQSTTPGGTASLPTIRWARRTVLEHARPTPQAPLASERVDIVRAVGRVLAAPVVADTDLPPFDSVMMDGFAVRAAEVAAGGWLLLQGEVAAGDAGELPLRPGHALSIMTGAPLPPGADAVVPVEWTEAEVTAGGEREAGVRAVRFLRGVNAGQHVAPRAEDLRAGALVAAAGERLTTLSLSLLIAAGAGRVDVVRRPTVALLTTGNELVPPGAPLRRGQIRESNGPALASLLADAGGDVTDLGVTRDTREALDAALRRAAEADIIVLTGGASVGAYDFTEEALLALGARKLFGKLSVKPGKPTLFFTRGRQLCFGLPGNPVAALMTGRLLVAAAVAARAGGSPADWSGHALPLAGDVRRVAERDQLLPMSVRDGALHFDGWHGSGDLSCMARAEGFAFVARGAGSAPAGESADWFPLPGQPAW
ncbi:MAG TPA: molybdopterin molybdotransferase MoeA [Planctomycetota bacterium]|nr:molybdopterin molybdotransferase MoeA [Planctomycetota bacterium]